LRPIAQAISHRPATSRKSQAMGDPLKVFAHLCSSPRSLPFVQRVRARKNSAAKSYDFEKEKTAYSARGGCLPLAPLAHLGHANRLGNCPLIGEDRN
jgi:hypothetical protein